MTVRWDCGSTGRRRTRGVSANVFHHNVRDTMIEVSHGPCLLDNNVFASPCTIQNFSQVLAFVNNLVCGHHRPASRDGPVHAVPLPRTAPKWPAARSFRAATTATATTCSPRPAARMTVRAWPRSMPMPGTRPRSTGYIRSVHEAVAEGVQGRRRTRIRSSRCTWAAMPTAACRHPIRNPMRFIPRNRSRSRFEETPEGVRRHRRRARGRAARRESVVRTADLGHAAHRRGAVREPGWYADHVRRGHHRRTARRPVRPWPVRRAACGRESFRMREAHGLISAQLSKGTEHVTNRANRARPGPRVLAAPEPEITVFRGIPFAAPPVGDRRWRAPRPVRTVAGERWRRTTLPPHARSLRRAVRTSSMTGMGATDPAIELNEDCLYLNILDPRATWQQAGYAGGRGPTAAG